MSTNDNQIKIHECVFNIDAICRNIRDTLKECNELGLTNKSLVYASVIRYCYMQVCSVSDEIELLHGYAKNDLYLRDTLDVLTPILRAIRKFTGIRKTRNYLIAHFNRNDQKDFHPWWVAMKDTKIPRTLKEVEGLNTWILVLNAIFVSRYYSDLTNFTDGIMPEIIEYEKWMVTEENQQRNESVFDGLQIEVAKKMEEKGIELLDIYGVFYKQNPSQ